MYITEIYIMWTVTLSGLMFLTLGSGYSTNQSFNGCVSTSFVEQYAFYYRIDQPLNLAQSFAVCNHRLTKYLGLQVHKSKPGSTTVYCGNDLFEVSPKLHESQCHPCREDGELFCGEDQAMAVYKLRDSTPFAVLMTADNSVEMLINNVTTVLVKDYETAGTSIGYIYHEDAIITVNSSLQRSYYQTSLMEFSKPFTIKATTSYKLTVAVDFRKSVAYWAYTKELAKTNLTSQATRTIGVLNITKNKLPYEISVDPYNRIVVYIHGYYQSVCTLYDLDTNTHRNIDLNYLQIEKIHTLKIQPQDELIYAVVNLNGDDKTYLISLDYELSRKHIFFSSSDLVKAHNVEVFKGVAVWLIVFYQTNISCIYMCDLQSECRDGDFKEYCFSQRIYDFAIYNPEIQTPGEKRLCSKIACQYGCKADSLFTAKCTCPPGMELNVMDNSTCNEVNSISPSTRISTSPPTTNSTSLSTITTSSTAVEVSRNCFFTEAILIICIAVLFFTQIILCVLVCNRKTRVPLFLNSQGYHQDLIDINDGYEVPYPR